LPTPSAVLAKQKTAVPDNLAGGIVHDFNNLLTLINGYSEILLATLAPDDPARALAAEIHVAGIRASELSSQLAWLPVCGGDTAPATGHKPALASSPGAHTVLLAEDEDGVRRLARRALELHGYRVLEARDGREALTMSDQHPGPIDLLLTDALMPEMGGCELADHLVQTRKDIKILYTSGYTDHVLARQGDLPTGAGFLQKPYSPDTLVQKVHAILND